MARDPMNRWIVEFVRQHGTRNAIGLQPGSALCANHVVVDGWTEQREVFVPAWAARVKALRNVFTGQAVRPTQQDERGATFVLTGKSAYAVE